VLLDPDRQSVSVVGKDWSHTLPRAPAVIDRATVSYAGPNIACATVRGDVQVYSLERQAPLYALAGAEG
jgi:hypothetical protein